MNMQNGEILFDIIFNLSTENRNSSHDGKLTRSRVKQNAIPELIELEGSRMVK